MDSTKVTQGVQGQGILTPGQRAYEEKRAAKAGMTLDAWMRQKERRARAEAAEAAKAADAALRARGLIVRGVAGYALPTCLRITVGTAEECGLVLDALAAHMRG